MQPTKSSIDSETNSSELLRRLAALQEEMAKRNLDPSRAAQDLTLSRTPTGPSFQHYQTDPVGFVTKELGFHPWSKQKEILESVRDNPRTTVRACHGVGKTACAAACGVWFLYSHPNSILLTTAPTWRQVKELLWREIRGHHARARLDGKCTTTSIQLAEQWFALGLSTDDPDKFQGFHAEDLLLIGDEAAGIPEMIFEAAFGILTSKRSRLLLIGNPTSSSGLFHASHHEAAETWKVIKISAFDSPNFTGEQCPERVKNRLTTPDWAEARKSEWGDDSPMYFARVLGEFPEQSEDALFSKAWTIKACDIIPKVSKDDIVAIGVDVARGGNCESVAYVRRGMRIIHMVAWRGSDLMASAHRVAGLIKQYKPERTIIDAVGIGAGVVDRLRDMRYRGIEGFHGGSAPADPSRFRMKRDEIYWNLRCLMKEGAIGPLADAKTRRQVEGIKAKYDNRGKLCVESKEDMRKRNAPSPDRADALVLCFAQRFRKTLAFS